MENARITTVKLSEKTKSRLDKLKEHKRESYDEVVQKMLAILNVVKEEPFKARAVLKDIDTTRKRVFSRKASG